MTDSDSITIWLEEVKHGDEEAARQLWERYFPYLVRLARKRLAGVPRRLEDEEDVALSAFESFCRAADQGRFPEVHDRHSLWRLLSSITHRKAVDLVRRSRTGLGDARVRTGSGLSGSKTSSAPPSRPGRPRRRHARSRRDAGRRSSAVAAHAARRGTANHCDRQDGGPYKPGDRRATGLRRTHGRATTEIHPRHLEGRV